MRGICAGPRQRNTDLLKPGKILPAVPALMLTPWPTLSLESVGTKMIAFSWPFYFAYFITVLLFSGFIFFVFNRFSQQKEEEKKELQRLKTALKEAEAKMAREKEVLPVMFEVAGAVFSTADKELIGTAIQECIEKILKLDLYLVIFFNKRKEKPILINKNISSSLCEAIAKACMGGDVSGLFEEDDLILEGMKLFDLDEGLGAFFATQDTLVNLSSEDILWLKLAALQLIFTEKWAELDVRTEKLAVTEKEARTFDCQYFRQQLETEWARAQRYNRRLSLVVLDVDDFNIYQETFGDEQKQLALNEIMHLIKDACRRSDIVASYLRDELAVILPETDVSGAFVAAERIREAIAQHEFLGKEGMRDTKLSASLGVASYPLNTADLEGLTREVEGALYTAKVTGRNRVCGPELPA